MRKKTFPVICYLLSLILLSAYLLSSVIRYFRALSDVFHCFQSPTPSPCKAQCGGTISLDGYQSCQFEWSLMKINGHGSTCLNLQKNPKAGNEILVEILHQKMQNQFSKM